jgi:hypothetical protein
MAEVYAINAPAMHRASMLAKVGRRVPSAGLASGNGRAPNDHIVRCLMAYVSPVRFEQDWLAAQAKQANS